MSAKYPRKPGSADEPRGRKRPPAKHTPERISDALSAFLKEAGLNERVVQAAVVPEWAQLVGREIAEVTEPLFVTADQTLFVGVRTNPWMSELQLLEPQILAALNADPGRPRVRRLRFQLLR